MSTSTNTRKNLIIIETDTQTCNELRSLLNDEYNIIRTINVKKAQSLIEAKETIFCAVLANAESLQADNGAFLKFMKNSIDFSFIPILVLLDSDTHEEAFIQFGSDVVDYIRKPYNEYIIKNRIANAIILKDSISMTGMETMLKELPSNIYLKNKEGRYIFATRHWHYIDHENDPNWTIRGKTDPEIRIDKENAIAAHEKDMEIIKTGKGTYYTIEVNKDGVQEFFDVIKSPLFDEDGSISGIIGLVNNVTEHEMLKKELKIKSHTDALTGLYNRTYLYEYLKIPQLKNHYPISIISADCDGLKYINDTYGHMAGDTYIQMAVALFRRVLPEKSVLFRTGGDEFLLLLPDTPADVAADLIKQMKDQEKQFQIRDQALSISFGASCLNSEEDSFEECLAESDKNLYIAKHKTHSKNNNSV